jgi:PAS domain S-box-containing protein
MFHSSLSKTVSDLSISHPHQLAPANRNYETLLKGVETIKDYAIFVLDLQGRILTWNKGAEAIQGYRAEEIIGQPSVIFYTPEAVSQHSFEHELELAKTQGRLETEGWRIRKDGTSFWANVVLSTIYDGHNEPIGFVKVSHDLTERRLAEEKIKTLYKGINAVEDYAIFLLDKEGRVSSWNKGAERIQGYREEEIIGKSSVIFYTPEAFSQHGFEHELETAKTQGRFEEEGWLVRKDGTLFWANVVITAIYDGQNEPVGFIKVSHDLTLRKQAERELAKSERDYRTLASIAPVGIFHCTPEGDLTYANPQACRFMGLSLEEAMGKGWLKTIHPEDREAVIIQWEDALKTGKTFTLEYRFYHQKTNKTIWVINQARPELDEKDQVKSYVQTITNINKRKMLEEKEREKAVFEKTQEAQRKMLENAEINQKKIKEFMDTVCHEIRNPLNGMVGSTEMLKEAIVQLKSLLKKHQKTLSFEIGSDFTNTLESLIDLYESLKQSVQQQKIIVDDVLDASKLEHNKLELKTAPFSPKGIVLASVQIFSAQFKQKGIQLDLKLPDKDIIIEGDAVRLKQALINLLSNALKFTKRGTIGVTLTEHCADEKTVELEIQVSDTGIGMDKEQISQLFKRFTQFASSSSSESYYDSEPMVKGAGLGLSISQQLIEMMGGSIEVKSEKGKGTEMNIKVAMPRSLTQKLCHSSSPKPESMYEADVGEEAGRKVLIVEDNLINQKVLIHFVKKLGWDYQIAENGLEALSRAEKNAFDVILMDIEMPVMNGLEATKQIRQHEQELDQPPAVIVGISANAQPAQIKIAKEAGMNDYITKPVHRSTVFKLLQGLPPRKKVEELPLLELPLSVSSSPPSLTAPTMAFFQTSALTTSESERERLTLQFKIATAELLGQQLPFHAHCENKYLTIELPSLAPYWRKLVLSQFKQLVEQVVSEKIVNATMTEEYLRLVAHTPEEALNLKTILSEAGFAEIFNTPSGYQIESETQHPQAYSS